MDHHDQMYGDAQHQHAQQQHAQQQAAAAHAAQAAAAAAAQHQQHASGAATPPAAAAAADFFLSNYRLGKTLGIGSFGKVRKMEREREELSRTRIKKARLPGPWRGARAGLCR